MSVTPPRVVLGVTGSIAAYKAADLVRRLQEQGLQVSVIMTRAAQEFISPLTMSTLSGYPVACDSFTSPAVWDVDHVSLAKGADLLLIAPATANIIAKLACGMADDLLSCTALATRAPKMIAPAMNTGMYRNPLTQANCEKLRANGYHVIDPVSGRLACGDEGDGHLADLQTIVAAVVSVLK